jgi:hypothetical protein
MGEESEMRERLIAVLAGAATLVGLSVVSAAPVAAATVTPAIDCTQNPSPNGQVSTHFTGQGVNIRTGPATNCTVVGSGYDTQSVTAHCEKLIGTTYWVYLKDNATGVKGWSDRRYVSLFGGAPNC